MKDQMIDYCITSYISICPPPKKTQKDRFYHCTVMCSTGVGHFCFPNWGQNQLQRESPEKQNSIELNQHFVLHTPLFAMENQSVIFRNG